MDGMDGHGPVGIAQANILIQDCAHKGIVSMIESDTPMCKLSEEPLSKPWSWST